MIKYLIVPLCDTATSYCHYEVSAKERNPISPATLKAIIAESLKENLTVQYLYPDYKIGAELTALINGYDHIDIVPARCEDKELRDNAQVVVFNGLDEIQGYEYSPSAAYVLRTPVEQFIYNISQVGDMIGSISRLNIIITDIGAFTEAVAARYEAALRQLIMYIVEEYRKGHYVQVNTLTDRIFLKSMNNCNAGVDTLSAGPDGAYYICPAFYHDGAQPCGTVATRISIADSYLLEQDRSPVCRRCDVWHCRRCVWLNRKFTRQINVPGYEQCEIAEVEKRVSESLLAELKAHTKLFDKY